MIVEIDAFTTKENYEKFVDGLIEMKDEDIYTDIFSKEKSETHKHRVKVTLEAIGEE